MNIKEIAKNATMGKGCPLMDGRTNVGTECVIDKVVHVDGMWLMQGKDGEYSVYTVTELPNDFLFGGKVMTDLLKDLLEQCSLDELNAELQGDPLAIKLTTKRSKNGRPYTAVEIV